MVVAQAVLTVALLAHSSQPGALQAGDAPTIADVFRAGESAVWVFESKGARIGHHASRYVGQDELAGARAHHFQGSLRLQLGAVAGVDLLSTADLWTDDRGHPIRFVQQALVGDTYSRVELAVAGKQSRATIAQGAKPREVPLDVDPAAHLLASNFVSHLEILVRLLPAGADARVEMFSGNTLQRFAYELKAKGAFEDEVGGARERGELYEDSLGERLRFADGRLIDIEIPAQQIVIRRSNELVEPVAIRAPAARQRAAQFDVEEVSIVHGEARIAGAITKRKGAQGRLPAVFFVSGSGPQDRDGISSGLDLGTHEILDHLTEQGLLVLRVDDRGAGASSPLPPDATFDDFVADARACVEFLARRDDVDPRRIALVGHSEGGQTVPILAAERAATSPAEPPSVHEVAAIVLLAPPGRPIVEVIADQNRLGLVNQGVTGDELERQMLDVRVFLTRLAGDEPIDAAGVSSEERSALASRAWFRSHARQDPLANIRKVKCPVLILHGAADFQVSAEKDAGALDAALRAAGHADHTLRVFPRLDHLFKAVTGERSELADYWKSRPVDAEFLRALSDWLGARLAARGG